ncbi:MAG: polysaccharide biosynthesis C-terminal domain-containing protein, partial [Candidatus Woesearchaeota archaeon]
HLEDQTNKIFYGDLFVMLLNLILTIFLVNNFGILGAAIGSGFSYFLVRFIFHRLSRKYIKIVHDLKFISKILVATLISITLSYTITNIIYNLASLHFFVFIALAGIVYFTSLLIFNRLLKIVSKEDLVILEMIEKYTKLNLNFVKRILL